MRVALHSIIRDGHETAYDVAHAAIPDDLVASFERLGIHDWQIWRSGRDLFHVVDCDDFAAAMRALDDDPANQRWQESINQHVDHFAMSGPGAEGMVLPQVWSLAAQRVDA
ncbi:L-rhamnose mutarotase [Leifsonia sp. 98AMF]|uniref:L-rhamnose mutarotase n=1 Tax=unclassified Leifsonia TaxID=2663824 RepID=UPI0008799C7C|nr:MULTISPECIES: L-rhamnose mutarotase [unclassified Leifsonia]SDH10985.1 L-rhamnose mutarotase [Leifsonia sp. 197AMF]SDJ27787.1 L-rhamnose mutarotase [Leifsonia sp. 466MF]SDK53232.1 L-rhamnose mutarotase [Leifsonia sp. 157MF]SDN49856.1 L-rhamnose mutarotase [Leifsonia sp. 509MF]SEN60678.1 L-rhamnose mutarotase [Leifsonia sp. 467MF]